MSRDGHYWPTAVIVPVRNTGVAESAVEWRGALCVAAVNCHSDVRAECRLRPRDPIGSPFHRKQIADLGRIKATRLTDPRVQVASLK